MSMITDQERAEYEAWRALTPEQRDHVLQLTRAEAFAARIDASLQARGGTRADDPRLAAILDTVIYTVAEAITHNEKQTELVRAVVVAELKRVEARSDQQFDELARRIDGQELSIGQTEPMIEQAEARAATNLRDQIDTVHTRLDGVEHTGRRTRQMLYGFFLFVLLFIFATLLARTAGATAVTGMALIVVTMLRRLLLGGVI
jgi:Flp pilus assembly protein TadB